MEIKDNQEQQVIVIDKESFPNIAALYKKRRQNIGMAIAGAIMATVFGATEIWYFIFLYQSYGWNIPYGATRRPLYTLPGLCGVGIIFFVAGLITAIYYSRKIKEIKK